MSGEIINSWTSSSSQLKGRYVTITRKPISYTAALRRSENRRRYYANLPRPLGAKNLKQTRQVVLSIWEMRSYIYMKFDFAIFRRVQHMAYIFSVKYVVDNSCFCCFMNKHYEVTLWISNKYLFIINWCFRNFTTVEVVHLNDITTYGTGFK